MQKTKDGSLLLDPFDVGKLIARLRRVAIRLHKDDPDLTTEMHRTIEELETGLGEVRQGVDLEVHGGRTFKRHAIRVKDHSHWETMVGELDGVRVYCRERGGRVKVILSKEDLFE
jgi:hypothetical protein